MMTLSNIYIYPIKSIGGYEVSHAQVTQKGLLHDRRWMLVDEKNKFITIRENPKMTLISAKIEDNTLVTSDQVSGKSISLNINQHTDEQCEVTIWNATVRAFKVGKEADNWFSEALGMFACLVYMPDDSHRPVDTTSGYHPAGKFTSFADAYPFLIIGNNSLIDLNARLDEKIEMGRFRPNFVFDGGQAYIEDTFDAFSIGSVSFIGLENCGRCNVPNVDIQTGLKNLKNEPLKTLSKYRNQNKSIVFGRNVVHGADGNITVGDKIELVK